MIPDYTPLCPSCGSETIGCLSCAGPLFSRLVEWLPAQGLSFDQQTLHLLLLDEIDAGLSHAEGQVLGTTEIKVVRFAAFDIKAEATQVRVVRGLHRVRFQAVALHELAHVWLANKRVLSLPPWACEGFCELLAYRFVSRFHSPGGVREAERIRANPDPVYGGGFRRMSDLSERLGFRTVLDYLAAGRLDVRLDA